MNETSLNATWAIISVIVFIVSGLFFPKFDPSLSNYSYCVYICGGRKGFGQTIKACIYSIFAFILLSIFRGCKIFWCCPIKKQNIHRVAEAQSNYFSVFSVPLWLVFYIKNQTILQSRTILMIIKVVTNS